MKNKQGGAALLISLIFLLVLTVIGVASMNDTIMQGKMAGAMQDSNIALQGVETSIREAEAFIETLTNRNGFGVTDGLYLQTDSVDPFDDANWTDAGSIQASAVAGLAENPRYMIQLAGEIQEDDSASSGVLDNDNHLGGGGQIYGFRIFSRSTGASGNSLRVVETFYGKRI